MGASHRGDGRFAFFVLLASPSAAKSKWVKSELDHWIAQRGTGELLLAVVDGALFWDEAAGRFDPVRSTAAPEALTRGDPAAKEPLFVDFSGRSPWELSDGQFRELVATLAAPIHGKSRDELSSDDRREQRRFQRWRNSAIALLAVLLVASIAAAVLALVQRNEAQDQRAAAETQRQEAENQRQRADQEADEARRQAAEALALALAAQSESALEENPGLAMALAAEAVSADKHTPRGVTGSTHERADCVRRRQLPADR